MKQRMLVMMKQHAIKYRMSSMEMAIDFMKNQNPSLASFMDNQPPETTQANSPDTSSDQT